MKKIVVDTGVFVALFNKKDRHFSKAVDFIKKYQNASLCTTEAVITETVYLLDFDVKAQLSFLDWISMSNLEVIPNSKDDFTKIKALMEQYMDLPMDYADGTLVNHYEKYEMSSVASFDSDFDLYRIKNKVKLSNIFKEN